MFRYCLLTFSIGILTSFAFGGGNAGVFESYTDVSIEQLAFYKLGDVIDDVEDDGLEKSISVSRYLVVKLPNIHPFSEPFGFAYQSITRFNIRAPPYTS